MMLSRCEIEQDSRGLLIGRSSVSQEPFAGSEPVRSGHGGGLMVELVVPDAFGRRDESNGLDTEGERRVDACTIIQLIGGISRAIAGASPALIAARLCTT